MEDATPAFRNNMSEKQVFSDACMKKEADTPETVNNDYGSSGSGSMAKQDSEMKKQENRNSFKELKLYNLGKLKEA